VLIYYILGLRMQAIGIMAREVMAPRGLTGLALVMLDLSMSDINKARPPTEGLHRVEIDSLTIPIGIVFIPRAYGVAYAGTLHARQG
jgi:hypothetical protein